MDVRCTEYLVLWLDIWNNLLRVGVFVSFALILTRVERDMVRDERLRHRSPVESQNGRQRPFVKSA